MNACCVQTIVSGGQTGVDRAALDVAIALGIDHCGWCPRGRLAEDGPIDAKYNLRETESPEYPQRTEQNVIDSDATLILYRGRVMGGTKLTQRMAEKHSRPCMLVDLAKEHELARVQQWLIDRQVLRLNIAGPRESSSPGIFQSAAEFLTRLFREPGDRQSNEE